MDDDQPEPLGASNAPLMLTIAEAKEALAKTLGVLPVSIEIIVRG